MADDLGEKEPSELGEEEGVDETDEKNLDVEGIDNEEDEEDSNEAEEGEEDIVEKDKAFVEEAWGEMPGEGEEGEEEEEVEKVAEKVEEEEEEMLEEEVPPDPSAPYDLSDESEADKAPFQLNSEQLEEVRQLWALFQDYTPVYTKIKDFITPVELVYMLKALNLHTFTPEQMYELIDFCVRPSNPDNHIKFDEFLWMVTIRQRDMPEEEEIRLALEVTDPTNSGIIDREYLRDVLRERGKKMKTVDTFIKEVDMANDGTLGLEDIVGTICLDLNTDEIAMLYNQIYPPEEAAENNIEALTT